MSYDLSLFEPVPGEDPFDTLERLAEEDESSAPDPVKAERNRRIAEALVAAQPGYDIIDLPDGIELTDESTAVQVSLYRDQAGITFPYWDSLDPAVLRDRIEEAARVIGAETGWRLYDPQLEKFIDPVADADAFAEAFGFGVRKVREIMSEEPAPPRPSLWQRLRGRG